MGTGTAPLHLDQAAIKVVSVAAVESFGQGFAQPEVARLLETSPQNAYRWHRKWTRWAGMPG